MLLAMGRQQHGEINDCRQRRPIAALVEQVLRDTNGAMRRQRCVGLFQHLCAVIHSPVVKCIAEDVEVCSWKRVVKEISAGETDAVVELVGRDPLDSSVLDAISRLTYSVLSPKPGGNQALKYSDKRNGGIKRVGLNRGAAVPLRLWGF